jgi:hypothetical protein
MRFRALGRPGSNFPEMTVLPSGSGGKTLMTKITLVAVSLALALSGLPAAGAEANPARSPSSDQAQSEAKAKDRQKEKEKEKVTPDQEKAKLFQLNPVVIDVVEKLRDKDVPNMTVVKTELFPMTIGVSLDSALERQAGVDVQRIQEVGTAVDDDSIKIRGLGSRRIKVLRNGRALNSSGVAGGYFIDWTMIPLAGADRVEVVKGVGDPRYGNVLGGIINLVPKTLRSERPQTEVQLSGASFATVSTNLFHGFRPGAFEYSISGGWTQSDGYLRNGGMNLGTANLHLGYDFPFRGRLTAELGYATTKKRFAVGNRISKVYGDPSYGTALDGAEPRRPRGLQHPGVAQPRLPQDVLRRPVARFLRPLSAQPRLPDDHRRDRLRPPQGRRRQEPCRRLPGPLRQRFVRLDQEP